MILIIYKWWEDRGHVWFEFIVDFLKHQYNNYWVSYILILSLSAMFTLYSMYIVYSSVINSNRTNELINNIKNNK